MLPYVDKSSSWLGPTPNMTHGRASSWNGWNWLFACVKCVSMDSQEIGNDLDDLVHSRKEEAGLKQQIDKLGEMRRGRKR
jgi:hypothetical protein